MSQARECCKSIPKKKKSQGRNWKMDRNPSQEGKRLLHLWKEAQSHSKRDADWNTWEPLNLNQIGQAPETLITAMPEGQDLEGLGLYVGTTSPASSLSDFVPCVLKYLCKDVDHRLMEALLMIVKGWKHLVMVQPLSHVRLFTSPWTAAHQASLSFTISRSLFKFISIELVMLSNHLIFLI